MARRSGIADLPLHSGTVPRWLADRMRDLGRLIAESIVENFGKREFLVRLSDPLWFQSFGAVLGMDWHSSGITTSVLYALKRGLNPIAHDLGIFVCGGRGKYSRETPAELFGVADRTGLDGNALSHASRLCAKVDNAAVQDGFQLYQHNFIVTDEGDWAVVQQGMNAANLTARRYHWCSSNLRSFVETPHTAVVGENLGEILNLTAYGAAPTRSSILSLSKEEPGRILREVNLIQNPGHSVVVSKQTDLFDVKAEKFEVTAGRNCRMPSHHEVRKEDVDLARLGGVLATAYESGPENFESLLLTPGLGPRTLQSLTLVSEIINGTPSRFSDPARFSFAHGGKDGHPFPVPCKIYDESIRVLGEAITRARLGDREKMDCLNRLHQTQLSVERECSPLADFGRTVAREKAHSAEWGGRTVLGGQELELS